jgi:ubiquinone/menaquinone biosynthesis C-methylase UbiE
MVQKEQWQLAGSAPEVYERYLVPALFGPWAPVLIDAAALRPGDRVLDLACGTGVVARQAKSQVGATGAVTGVDLNPGMLAIARSVEPSVDWHEGNAGALPLPTVVLTWSSANWGCSTSPTDPPPSGKCIEY